MFGFSPLDSFESFFFFTMLMLAWFMWSIASAAKKIAENETVQEVSKGFLGSWLESFFKK